MAKKKKKKEEENRRKDFFERGKNKISLKFSSRVLFLWGLMNCRRESNPPLYSRPSDSTDYQSSYLHEGANQFPRIIHSQPSV